jgi:coproporphyrinogen III oxidase-like Fe-S oxidoreductase
VKRLIDTRKLGFITTVDLVYGLPGQTVQGFLGAIKRLIEIGIYGVSLYRFNLSRRNMLFIRKFPAFSPDVLLDYVIYQAAEQIFVNAGYRKNHFSHFALPEDGNLYYNHANRGEDLLAFGTSADGIFGHYHYRHPGFSQYVAGNNSDIPMLEGGIMKSAVEQAVQPAVDSLMCSDIRRSTFQKIGGEALLDAWTDRGLIAGTADDDRLTLTANGSWCVDYMIQEVHNKVR